MESTKQIMGKVVQRLCKGEPDNLEIVEDLEALKAEMIALEKKKLTIENEVPFN